MGSLEQAGGDADSLADVVQLDRRVLSRRREAAPWRRFASIPGESVLWLSLGDHDHVIDGTTEGGYDFSWAPAAPLGNTCSAEPCWVGWEVADIRVAANSDFAESNPVAMALFEVVELTIDDIAAASVHYDAGENTEADVRRHAAEWVADHRVLVDEWLATARSAG